MLDPEQHEVLYAFPTAGEPYGRVSNRYSRDSMGVADWWVQNAGVAVVPGDAFWGPGHVQFCYRVDEGIEQGLRRLGDPLDGIHATKVPPSRGDRSHA